MTQIVHSYQQVIEFCTLLESESSKNHIEFFFENDAERVKGLTNHIPLTYIASCYLGARATHLGDFEDSYSKMLQKFNATLVKISNTVSHLTLKQ